MKFLQRSRSLINYNWKQCFYDVKIHLKITNLKDWINQVNLAVVWNDAAANGFTAPNGAKPIKNKHEINV